MTLLRFIAVLLFTIAGPASAQEFKLELPIACEFGKTCWVQQYPDHDAGPGASDYTCGGQTYDGHDGTDIRVLDTKSIADVVASAPGTVTGLRDGVEDRLARTPEDRAAIAKIECGNGVVIAHDGGYETQYCHMRNGSIAVKKGDAVAAGQKLGQVGYSGDAAFPHVHLSVRRNGDKLDPFSGAAATACDAPDQSMWSDSAAAKLAYVDGTLLRLGFASGKVEMEALEEGRISVDPPTDDWPALVTYVWAINLKKGDTIRIDLRKPDGQTLTNSVTLDRNKAQYVLFTGERRPATGWRKGAYRAAVKVERDGKTIVSRASEATIE
ncbi:MAG: M23 family metallopeptidase [Rhizobiales bacterium]|nr:M23 family metallopeptidase [Hyphomicrobiales bacterium]